MLGSDIINVDQLDLAYEKLKDLVSRNFNVVFSKCATGGEVAILQDLLKENTPIPDLPMHHEVWLDIRRIITYKKSPKIGLDVCTITLSFKGGLSYSEAQLLPIDVYPSIPISRDSLILTYTIPGIDDTGVLMRYQLLHFRSIDGINIILSGKRDDDILEVLNASYSRYMSQLAGINHQK
jgi:hypothetical protein